MSHYILLASLITVGYSGKCLCPNQGGKTPVITNSYTVSGNSKGSVCAGCDYSYTYPAGYDYLDISARYGQTFTQTFRQNGKLLDVCKNTKICNKKIELDTNYPVETVISRRTGTNSYYTHGTHQIDFGKRKYSTRRYKRNTINISQPICDSPPELNVDSDDQSGYIDSGCSYTYSQTIGNSIIIDMSFNSNVSIIIYSLDTGSILYNNTGYLFFEQINSTEYNIGLTVSSTTNTTVELFNLYGINDDESEMTNDSNNPIIPGNDDDDDYVAQEISNLCNKSDYDNVKKFAIVAFILSITLSALFIIIIIYTCIIRCNNSSKFELNKNALDYAAF